MNGCHPKLFVENPCYSTKGGVHCIPHKLTVYQVELNVYDPKCLAHDLGQGATGTTGTTLNVEATDECPASFVTEDGIINEDSGVTATAALSLLGMAAMRRLLQPLGKNLCWFTNVNNKL